MHRFQVSGEIEASADRVWALFDDFGNTYVFHPRVEHSETTNGQACGLGAARRCTMYNGDTIEEEIVAYDRDAGTLRIQLTDYGPFPLKHMQVDVTIEALGAQRARLSFEGGFVPKYGPLGWLMGKAMMRAQFAKLMEQMIEGVRAHLATGRIVGRGGELGPELGQVSAA